MDILFSTEEYVFSYRVAGICVQNRSVLLQKPTNDTAFAFPGGHVAFGESNEQTLIREFQEEIGADISVGDLKWVGEIFFPWGNKPCHQICLYYTVEINSKNIPMEGMFMGKEQLEGQQFKLEFHWVPFEKLKSTEVYPTNVVQLMNHIEGGVQHFVYRE
ncbi:MAG: NUDIX hydrolase [Lachnospiraceae bacterium]|jgi:ADP-ribose pyrophosphatase